MRCSTCLQHKCSTASSLGTAPKLQASLPIDNDNKHTFQSHPLFATTYQLPNPIQDHNHGQPTIKVIPPSPSSPAKRSLLTHKAPGTTTTTTTTAPKTQQPHEHPKTAPTPPRPLPRSLSNNNPSKTTPPKPPNPRPPTSGRNAPPPRVATRAMGLRHRNSSKDSRVLLR